MALYHFTVKNDKRPRTKTQIPAVEHSDYINREGKYKNVDERQPQSMDNVISSNRKPDAIDGRTVLLYSSPYGKITNTEKGIAVTDDPSYDTISMALIVAKETMDEPLNVNGSLAFKAKCIHAAVLADLPISFKDQNMQSVFDKKRKEKQDERERFREQGGRVIIRKNIPKPDIDENQRGNAETVTIGTLPTMRQLSKLPVDGTRSENATMLVSGDESGQLGHDGDTRNPPMRWDLSDGREQYARRTARRILDNIESNMDAIYAQRHVEYINREKAFSERGDCVYKQHHLPKWAKDSPSVFFRAADRYSPKNAARYKELEFALQNELTLEQNLEIVNRFIQENLPDHYYTLAVHDKIGAMSDGTHNLHVHLVFSTRLIDEVEKKKERKRSAYFRYPLRDNVKEKTEDAMRSHGAPIDRKWSDRTYIPHLRASYEEIVNSVLEKYGYSARIDHRSLKAQEQEARMNGDIVLANLLHRIPEEHISKHGVLEESNPQVQRIKKYRIHKKEYQDLLFASELVAHGIEEDERKEKTGRLKKNIKAVVSSNEFIESENDANSHIGELQDSLVEAVHTHEHLQRMLVSAEDARENAKLEYMMPEEKETYQAYKKLLSDIQRWTDFKENLSEPKNPTNEGLAAYRQLLPALDEKLSNLQHEKALLQDKIDELEIRLQNTDIQKQIQLITHKTLQANVKIRKELAKAEQNLEISIRALEQGLFSETHAENQQDTYTTHQLYSIIRKRFYGYKKEVERLQKQLDDAKKKVLSMDRALQMASNIYTKGGLKKLREDLRSLKKKEGYLQSDQAKLEQDIAAFRKLPTPPSTDRDLYAEYQERYSALASRRDKLNQRIHDLANQKIELEQRKKRLAAQIDSLQGKAKIKDIAPGIMKKKAPYQEQYDALHERLERATGKMNRANVQMEALAKAVQKDKDNTQRYKVAAHVKAKDMPGIIAEAVSGNSHYASLVATMRDDNRSLKTWTLMSEAAKEEETNKQLYQDLI